MSYRWFAFFLLVLMCTAALGAAEYPLREAVECTPRRGLPNFFAKLEQGGEVRVAYLGGSITAQAGWRVKSRAWLQEQYPPAKVEEIHAAIGGTGSDLGVFRLQHDALRHQPDLLFVEFAVNDGGAAPERIQQAMEGIVRQTWKANPRTDICYVYTLAHDGMLKNLRDGKFPRAASAMEELADRYGIPSIHLGLKVAQLEAQGKLVFKGAKPKTAEEQAALGDKILFSPDAVHPYADTGHQLYLEAIVRSLPAIKAAGKPGPHALGAPLRADNWEAAKILPLGAAKLSAGWRRMNPEKDTLAKRFGNRLPEMWRAEKPGETISFKFKGTTARIYDLLGPDCGQVIVKVDDAKPVVKPRFDAYCTYHRLATMTVAEGLPDAVHTVTLEIHPEQPDKAAILAKRNEKIDKPERFDGTAWYAGGLLILGDLVE